MSMLQMSSTWVMGESSVRARDSATLASLVNGGTHDYLKSFQMTI
jgi:hypothetical protein